MSLTNFPHGILSFGNIVSGTPGVGNIYIVWQTSKTAIMSDMLSKYSDTTYPDGSKVLYQDAGTGDGIAAAITACKGGRNDYIFVGTGNYNLTTALSLSGKSSVHLIGMNGLNFDVSSVGAAALTQTGAYPAITMEAYGEVAGFQIINKAGYPAINAAANIWRMQVHNNCFHMVGGTACSIIDFSAAATNSYGRIFKNRFATWVGGNLTAAINVGTATGCDICENIITYYNGTLTYGIVSAGAQCVIADNFISDSGGGGTITTAITIFTYSSAIGNRCAVGAGAALAGGTAAHSFVDNMDGSTGATNGAASNLET